MKFVEREKTSPTIKDDYHDQVTEALFGEDDYDDYGDMEEYDDGKLISTVDDEKK